MDLLQNTIWGDGILDKEGFMNSSMQLYSLHKDQVDNLIKTYNHLRTNRYQPAKVLQSSCSRNGKLTKNGQDMKSKKSTNILRLNRLNTNATVSSIPMTARIVSSKAKHSLKQPKSCALKSSSSKHKNWKSIYKQLSPFQVGAGKTIPSRNREFKKSKSISTNGTQFCVGLKNPKMYAKLTNLKSSFEASKNTKDLISTSKHDYFWTSKEAAGDINRTQEVHLADSEKWTPRVAPKMKSSMLKTPMDVTLELPSASNESSTNLGVPSNRKEFKGRVWNSGIAPHGGSGFNNEERLNIQTQQNEPKFEPKASFENREKSIELSVKSGWIKGVNQNMLTQKLINSNKLSKYLTGFIGGKDYRTSEEKEFAKWTFNPRTYPKHRRYKDIKAKLSPYIKGQSKAVKLDSSKVKNPQTPYKVKELRSILKSSQSSQKQSQSVYTVDIYTEKTKSAKKVKMNHQKSPSRQSLYLPNKDKGLSALFNMGYSQKYQNSTYFVTPTKKHTEKMKRVKRVMSPTQTVQIDLNKGDKSFRKNYKSIEKIPWNKRAFSINHQDQIFRLE